MKSNDPSSQTPGSWKEDWQEFKYAMLGILIFGPPVFGLYLIYANSGGAFWRHWTWTLIVLGAIAAWFALLLAIFYVSAILSSTRRLWREVKYYLCIANTALPFLGELYWLLQHSTRSLFEIESRLARMASTEPAMFAGRIERLAEEVQELENSVGYSLMEDLRVLHAKDVDVSFHKRHREQLMRCQCTRKIETSGDWFPDWYMLEFESSGICDDTKSLRDACEHLSLRLDALEVLLIKKNSGLLQRQQPTDTEFYPWGYAAFQKAQFEQQRCALLKLMVGHLFQFVVKD